MAKTAEQMLEMMMAPARDHCPEPLVAAMQCSHAGSMASALTAAITRYGPGLSKTSSLPNPVLIVVGEQSVYAFDFKPRGFKVKIKREAARWPREAMTVVVGDGKRVNQFALCVGDEYFELEAATLGRDSAVEALDRFFDSIGRAPGPG